MTDGTALVILQSISVERVSVKRTCMQRYPQECRADGEILPRETSWEWFPPESMSIPQLLKERMVDTRSMAMLRKPVLGRLGWTTTQVVLIRRRWANFN